MYRFPSARTEELLLIFFIAWSCRVKAIYQDLVRSLCVVSSLHQWEWDKEREMFSLLYGLWKYLFSKAEFHALILGVDKAGKTVSFSLFQNLDREKGSVRFFGFIFCEKIPQPWENRYLISITIFWFTLTKLLFKTLNREI
mgnify:CR=1 FL=1